MEAVTHWLEMGAWGSLGLAVLALLFKQTKATACLFCSALLFAGVYLISDALTLHTKGLGREFGGHTSHIVSIAAHPTETAISFWFNVLFGGAIAIMTLIGMIAYALSLREKTTTEKD